MLVVFLECGISGPQGDAEAFPRSPGAFLPAESALAGLNEIVALAGFNEIVALICIFLGC